ncbi:unnamed protein product [Heterobilharzia americana]|nr:unnamed protein product [Heterobilharzia americana]
MPLDLKCTLRPINGTVEEFNHLPEFRPLSWMPRGNVGTPTQHFFNLVKECKLQSSIISKLHLDFAIRAKIRKYGAVPFIYDDSSVNSAQPNSSPDLQTDRPNCNVTRRSVSIKHNPSFKDTFGHISSVDFDDGDDDIPEEWDRFEALHDDPYNLDRGNKAQLKYESKVELVWEKGGSGLVFHTDQRTWEKLDPLRKEEIFDEPSSFDWDIDMQPYEAPTAIGSGPTPNGFTGAERDTAELIDINREKESMDVQDLAYNVYAAFSNEVITKGYGGRILERMGWTPGTALSVKSSHSKVTSGLIDPITCEGSLPPKVRTGLGYYGPRILRNSCKKMLNPGSTFINKEQKLKSVYIRSVFDSPQTVARRSGLGLFPSLLRRNDPGLVVKWLSDKKVSSTSPTESTVPLDERILIKNRTIILNSYGNLSKEGISFVSGGYLNPS